MEFSWDDQEDESLSWDIQPSNLAKEPIPLLIDQP
jgi:hypothetical protein